MNIFLVTHIKNQNSPIYGEAIHNVQVNYHFDMEKVSGDKATMDFLAFRLFPRDLIFFLSVKKNGPKHALALLCINALNIEEKIKIFLGFRG